MRREERSATLNRTAQRESRRKTEGDLRITRECTTEGALDRGTFVLYRTSERAALATRVNELPVRLETASRWCSRRDKAHQREGFVAVKALPAQASASARRVGSDGRARSDAGCARHAPRRNLPKLAAANTPANPAAFRQRELRWARAGFHPMR